jgi:hypothetical protein
MQNVSTVEHDCEVFVAVSRRTANSNPFAAMVLLHWKLPFITPEKSIQRTLHSRPLQCKTTLEKARNVRKFEIPEPKPRHFWI